MSTLKTLTFDRSASSAWYHFTEAWLKLSYLNSDNFATDRVVVYDPQVDYTEKIHNHDGLNSRILSANSVTMESINVNSTRVLRTSYFNQSTRYYTMVTGTLDVAVTTAAGAFFYGTTTVANSHLDLINLGSYRTSVGTSNISAIYAHLEYLSPSNVMFPPVVSYETATGWKISVTGKVSMTVQVQFMALLWSGD